jgi:hypothetical protein
MQPYSLRKREYLISFAATVPQTPSSPIITPHPRLRMGRAVGVIGFTGETALVAKWPNPVRLRSTKAAAGVVRRHDVGYDRGCVDGVTGWQGCVRIRRVSWPAVALVELADATDLPARRAGAVFGRFVRSKMVTNKVDSTARVGITVGTARPRGHIRTRDLPDARLHRFAASSGTRRFPAGHN